MAAKKKAAKAATAPKRKYTRRSNGIDDSGPEGFTKVESPHISGFWIPALKGQAIRGIVQEFTTKEGIDGKPNVWANFLLTHDDVSGDVMGADPADPTRKRKLKVEVGSGMIIGLSGAVLLSRLRGREGKEVYIRYAGLGPKVKGKHQARLYDVFEKSA